jgi:hypothetical protein
VSSTHENSSAARRAKFHPELHLRWIKEFRHGPWECSPKKQLGEKKKERHIMRIKAPISSTLLAFSLFSVTQGHAQSETSKPTTKDNHGGFTVPKPMQIEHDELHSALAKLTKAGGRTGEAARNVAAVLGPHFTKENEYALPPLSLLGPITQGKFDCSMTAVLKLTDKLEAEMPTMLSEHKNIAAVLDKLKDAATSENNQAGVQFAEHLAAHAQTEEHVTYPTALLIGLYVKNRAAQCPP